MQARRRWLGDRPIRTKLSIILLLPVLAIVALTGLSVASAAGRAGDAGQARELVAVGGISARLAMLLQHERAAAALVFAESSSVTSLDEYRRAGTATDTVAAVVRAELAGIELPGSLASLMARVDADVVGLASLRQKVIAAPDAVLSAVAFQYRAAIADLISFRQALGQVGVSSATANELRSVAALSQAIESLSQLQVAAVRVIAAGRLTPAGQQEIVAANTGITEAMQTFVDLGPPSWPAALNSRIGGGERVLLAERLQGLVVRSQPGTALDLGTDARGWSTAVGARVDVMHAVETDLDSELLAAVTAERDAEWRSIFTALSVVAVLLVIVVAIGSVVARSLTGSLTRLQAGALDVAVRRLPEMVRGLDVDSADRATVARLMAVAAEPIPADGADEVGQVADAFNRVTSSAVALAGEQAALRAGVGAILVSLSRRLQLRADAMMVSLDALEQRETNPERLEKLFALDHIATQLRRLIVNLQIQAGGRAGRQRSEAVALADVLRAAGQQIDAYTRVAATAVDEPVTVRGEVVDEVIHLLAELLDNATRFSPPESQVWVEAKRVGDLLHIQIRDEGTGMGEAELRLARDRVAQPYRLDHRTTQHMGLPAVGVIAQRHGIKIEFRSVEQVGTWVDLTIPANLVDRRQWLVFEPTAELAPVATTARAASPPTWPPLPPALPVATAPPVALAEPVIFEDLLRDPTCSWFQPTTPAERAVLSVSPSWQAAARAAEAVHTAVAAERTRSGLPVREPMRRVIPSVEPAAGVPARVWRQPDQVRRQMSAFQHGLGLAGRRQVHHG